MMNADNQIEIPFEEDEVQIGPIYLSGIADEALATETILNLGYYFYRAKESEIEVETLFPKAVHLIERDDYRIGREALTELKTRLNAVKGDVNKLSARGIMLAYKLIAYSKGHKRGRMKGFMSLSILKEKDIFKVKELIKRMIDFFEQHPNGEFKVNVVKRKNSVEGGRYIHYVQNDTLWEMVLFNGELKDYDLSLLTRKQTIYKKESGYVLSDPSIGVFNLCTNEKREVKKEFFLAVVFNILTFICNVLIAILSAKPRRKRY